MHESECVSTDFSNILLLQWQLNKSLNVVLNLGHTTTDKKKDKRLTFSLGIERPQLFVQGTGYLAHCAAI